MAIAARLSENPDVTVGVIEAGKYRIGDPLVDTPAAFFQMFENPEYDWCMYTTPQVNIYSVFFSDLSINVYSHDVGGKPRQNSAYPARQSPRWFQCHQLYDVRPRLVAGL